MFFGASLRSVVLLSALTSTFAADYYVSPSGRDTNAGTSASSPWQTITKVNGTKLIPGDRVYFQGGQSFAGTINLTSSGTAASPILITSYGTGRATVAAGTGRGVLAYNVAGYQISNLNFVGSGRTVNTVEGINFYADLAGNVKLDTVRIDNVDVSGFGAHGITVSSWNGLTGFQNVRITYAIVHDNANNGILMFGYWPVATGYAHRNVYIGHCTTYNNTGIAGKPAATGSGIAISEVDGGVIERSLAVNNGTLSTSSGGPVGIWTYDSNNITIQYNESYSNHTASNTDGGGFDIDGGVTNSVIQYNYSHDNDGPGYLFAQYTDARPFSGNRIRFNISQNDARKNSAAAIRVWNGGSGVANSEIYANTVYISPAPSGVPPAIMIDVPTTNIHVRNNIFITSGGLPVVSVSAGQIGMLFQGNAYWSGTSPLSILWGGQNFATLTDWRNASGQENVNGTWVGLNVNPMLTGVGTGGAINNSDQLTTLTAYRLQQGSPVMGSGVNLSNLGINEGPSDFWGTSVPTSTGYDIGAGAYYSVSATGNNAPQVSAGANATVTLPNAFTLQGTATDDGLPYGTLSQTWQQTAGPATAAISNTAVLNPTVTFPAAGTYTFQLTASDGSLTSSASVTITVQAQVLPKDFSLALSTSSITVARTADPTLTVTVGSLNGFSGVVSLSASGMPSRSSAKFTPSSLTGSGNSTLQIVTGNKAAAGTYTITVTATSGTLVHTAVLKLTLQ